MAGGGAKPGERRGGRQKGAANRRSQDLIDQLEAIGLDPVRELAEALQAAKASGDLNAWIAASKSLLPFLYPRRKSVDLAVAGPPVQLQIITGISDQPPDHSDVLARLERALDR